MTGIVASAAATRVAGVLGGIPRWVWVVLAVAGLLLVGKCTHDNAVERTIAEARAERDREWQLAFDEMRDAALQWRRNYESKASEISSHIGAEHEQNLRANRARADDLRLRGPGQAAAGCGPRDAGAAATSGGHVAAGGVVNAGLDRVPEDEPLALVSWPDLINRAEEADANRDEVEAWRQWYNEQDTLRRVTADDIPEPTFGRE